MLSHTVLSDSATSWTVAWQASLSIGFSRQEYWSGLAFPSPGDLPNPGIKSRSPVLQKDSLPAEPQGKPKNTGVGSLSLLQQIFLTWKSNQDLQRCRWILYQLSYQGSPFFTVEKERKENEVAQLCPSLCYPMDCSLPGSCFHGIFRQEYWSGLPFPSPGDLPDPGIELGSPALQADALLSELPGKPILHCRWSLFFNEIVYK